MTPPGPWRGAIAALCALLVGIGLARFAYTPLLPALAEAGWFDAAEAAYLGAANLGGYLLGALLARTVAARTSTTFALRGGMALASVAFFACSQPWPFAWFAVWRCLAGISGGVLMVLAAPTVLPNVPPHRQGLAGGVILTGVALGIALSGTLIPVTLTWGVAETWITLGVLSVILTAVAWSGWPDAADRSRSRRPRTSTALRSLYLEYGLNAVGLVPHMVFWVVFIAQGLDKGIAVGSLHWVVFSIGAVLGPVTVGYLADRTGFLVALRWGFVVQAVFTGLVVLTDHTAVLFLSSLVMGAFVPVSVTLVLGRMRELIPGDADAQTGGWRWATIAFAVGQAAGAYGLSYLFDLTSGFETLFAVGSGVLVLALLLNLVFGKRV